MQKPWNGISPLGVVVVVQLTISKLKINACADSKISLHIGISLQLCMHNVPLTRIYMKLMRLRVNDVITVQ